MAIRIRFPGRSINEEERIHNNLIYVFEKLGVLTGQETVQAERGQMLQIFVPGSYSVNMPVEPIEVLGKFEVTELFDE